MNLWGLLLLLLCVYQWTCAFECPAGFGPNGLDCVQCKKGYFSPGQNQTCAKCHAGMYANGTGSATCIPCGVGKYAPSVGASACRLCPVGSIGNRTGSPFCYPCSSDQYSYSLGEITCEPMHAAFTLIRVFRFYQMLDGACAQNGIYCFFNLHLSLSLS